MLADATTAVRHELKARQDFSRLMLNCIRASLGKLEGQRAEEAAAETVAGTPKPGAAPGCGELLRPADRHVLEVATVVNVLCIQSLSFLHCVLP